MSCISNGLIIHPKLNIPFGNYNLNIKLCSWKKSTRVNQMMYINVKQKIKYITNMYIKLYIYIIYIVRGKAI